MCVISLSNYDYLRFTEVDDINWFTKTVSRICREDVGEEFVPMVETVHYFVDFLRYCVDQLVLWFSVTCVAFIFLHLCDCFFIFHIWRVTAKALCTLLVQIIFKVQSKSFQIP